MYAKLNDRLRRPALYERAIAPFWDDPHIAARMLAAHLDPDTDAASRRPEFMDRSADWLATLVPSGARLLDIGCGPGLYGKRLSALGLQVTGLDISASSIGYARSHDPAGEYRVQDYLAMDLAAAFDIVTLIWCDYGALTSTERHALLPRVARALRPGGLFVLDAFTPAWLAGRAESTSWSLNDAGGFFSPFPHLHLSAEYHYGDRVSLDRHVVIAEDARVHNIWNTCFARQELLDEVASFGFTEIGFFDDVAGSPHTGTGPTLCAVLERG